MLVCLIQIQRTKIFSPTSEKCKARGFTVIVDGRKSQWNIVKTVVLMLQVQTAAPGCFWFLMCFTLINTRIQVVTFFVWLGFQNVIPAEVSLVCVVKPDEFWDKKVTHFCFWKEKDRLGFEVSLSCCFKPAFRLYKWTSASVWTRRRFWCCGRPPALFQN